jgi:hypothetical protein
MCRLVYANSRLLDSQRQNHPTSAFAAASVSNLISISPPEYLVLAMGLIGDRSLERYPDFLAWLHHEFGHIFGENLSWESPLGKLTSRLNALFRATPGRTPARVHSVLEDLLLSTNNVQRSFSEFIRRYRLEECEQKISRDVQFALENLQEQSRRSLHDNGGVLCGVCDMQTFSVGIVATILAERKIAPVVSLGFPHKDRVQFELRTHPDTDLDLTAILAKQRSIFRPITSGGHPKAAGALVFSKDTEEFCHTLRLSVEKTKP